MPEIVPTDKDHEDPELEEIQQREIASRAVLVEHNGPIQAQLLPARGQPLMRTIVLDTTPQLILARDLSRQSVILLADTGSFIVGTSRSSVSDGSAATWPAGLPLPVGHASALWAKASTGTVNLTIISETWAGG